MLSARAMRKTFHAGTSNERVALNNVSLDLAPGDFAVIVGGNGAGKSTFINAIAGEVSVDAGAVRLAERTRVGARG